MRHITLTAVVISALGLLSCVQTVAPLPPVSMDFFVPAANDNPWRMKIQNWQARHHLDMLPTRTVATDSPLASELDQFEAGLRREVAAQTVRFVQEQSRLHYRPDGKQDHWATLGEVIESGGDDCDGLDMLTFVTLRRLGFEAGEIYRAIVVDKLSGQHHMVTLWFDAGREGDPFVLDPTGVVTAEMVRLSDVPDWEPSELFDESAHFRAKPSRQSSVAASMAD